MYDYNAIITNVVDGDTYDVDIDLGFHIHIHERIRVLDLNTPETRGEEKELGLICKEWAKQNFLNKECKLYSKKEITGPRTDSFGRWLCTIWIKGELEDIASTFSSFGCNKLENNYSEDLVKELRFKIID